MLDQAIRTATRRILPLLMICYFINILDRTNLSVAALKMNPDLGLSATAYGLGAGIFYISYFLCGLPSNMFLARFGARRWMAIVLGVWGIASGLTSIVWNEPSFFVVRFLLGAAEAGFFPGVIYYFSQWFDKRNNARIVAMFYAVIPLSSAVAAPISTVLLLTSGWRLLFVLESVPAIIMAFFVLRLLPDDIESAPWLSAEQKVVLRASVADGAGDGQHAESQGAVSRALRDRQTILLSLIYFLLTIGTQAIGIWLPLVVQSMGFDTLASGMISAIPYAFGAVLVPLWGAHSSRTNERYWHAFIPMAGAFVLFSIGGFVSAGPWVSIALLSLGFSCTLAAASSFWGLPRVLTVGAAAAASTAIINSFGNFAGFVGPTITGAMKESTGSFTIVLSLLGVPVLVAAVLSLIAGRMGERQDEPTAAPAASTQA